ncbi:hypothetical protein TRFO_02692 [Tritrichomonas foetus]|uniref:Casein kinase II subunit beta n=1 Tax=Tritrichomonas foetus TaxID=1144522 RepID=A0A1J4KYW0_9EUKA|nr:hypothetical protein TRFO_02692 [Tritrichomonas foetus]|eukprot:OHT16433.1 hypothetical protein TRFO_02692 [Tritrichomonas foetus]
MDFSHLHTHQNNTFDHFSNEELCKELLKSDFNSNFLLPPHRKLSPLLDVESSETKDYWDPNFHNPNRNSSSTYYLDLKWKKPFSPYNVKLKYFKNSLQIKSNESNLKDCTSFLCRCDEVIFFNKDQFHGNYLCLPFAKKMRETKNKGQFNRKILNKTKKDDSFPNLNSNPMSGINSNSKSDDKTCYALFIHPKLDKIYETSEFISKNLYNILKECVPANKKLVSYSIPKIDVFQEMKKEKSEKKYYFHLGEEGTVPKNKVHYNGLAKPLNIENEDETPQNSCHINSPFFVVLFEKSRCENNDMFYVFGICFIQKPLEALSVRDIIYRRIDKTQGIEKLLFLIKITLGKVDNNGELNADINGGRLDKSSNSTLSIFKKYQFFSKYFVLIDRNFLNDSFNYWNCEPNGIESSYNRLVGQNGVSFKEARNALMNETSILDYKDFIEKSEGKFRLLFSVFNLYGLLHAQYLLTAPGQARMLEVYHCRVFQKCPRDKCNKIKCLPYGVTEQPCCQNIKMFCPLCKNVYNSKKEKHVDGAFFGPTYVHLFLQKFPDIAKCYSNNNNVNEQKNDQANINSAEKPCFSMFGLPVDSP